MGVEPAIGEDGRLHGQPCHCALFSDTLAVLSPSEPHSWLGNIWAAGARVDVAWQPVGGLAPEQLPAVLHVGDADGATHCTLLAADAEVCGVAPAAGVTPPRIFR
jgi:hypothetical protein